jgi:hypothetical protein
VIRLRFVLADLWTSMKHRHAFETAQRCASWKETIAPPRVTAPREQRRQWRKVLRFRKTA